tara:strand:- start:1160 stop:1333 length:174 start_codon:yes stop_codon:yes gene_type:complete
LLFPHVSEWGGLGAALLFLGARELLLHLKRRQKGAFSYAVAKVVVVQNTVVLAPETS